MNYSFQSLLKRFTTMTDEDVMEEYAYVAQRIHTLKESGKLMDSENIDNLNSAYDFLGHYLAHKVCSSFGYDIIT